jgi:endonuclease/exonuclease/phosphatase (EEP) superfamily protein YafD
MPVVSAHLMTPRDGIEAMIHSRLGGLEAFRDITGVQRAESALLRRWAAAAPGSLLLAGDFNLTVEHPLYRHEWSSYANAFSEAGLGLGQTKFTRLFGIRIDHILCGTGWRPVDCWVGPDVGSDHRPVLADLSWIGTSADPP